MPETAAGMTTAGWMFLATAWGAILALAAFCVARVLTTPKPPTEEEEDR